MSDYTKIVIESDAAGRINISCENSEGSGHGYRIAGSKYINDHVSGKFAKVLARVELDERDVEEIRSYLGIWDEIQAAKTATKEV